MDTETKQNKKPTKPWALFFTLGEINISVSMMHHKKKKKKKDWLLYFFPCSCKLFNYTYDE